MKLKIITANTMATKTYIALGTNLGDREKNLQTALIELEKFCKIIKKSSIYETEPVGFKEQDNFLNMVIEATTNLSPTELIINLQEIEHKMGRIKEVENGPRIIDLDILFCDDLLINMPNLLVPHPRLHKRNFVMEPLVEIAKDFIHPKLKKSIATIHKSLKNSEKVTLWI